MKAFVLILILASAAPVFSQVPPRMRCEFPPSPKCEDFVNSKLSRWDQRDEYLQRQLTSACAGNKGDACVSFSAENLPWYDVKDANEMIQVARSCQLADLECVKYVSSRLSRYEYNEPNEISNVNRACARADVECVKTACESRDYDCDRRYEILQAARSCFKPCWPR